jgi:hypothetical protein
MHDRVEIQEREFVGHDRTRALISLSVERDYEYGEQGGQPEYTISPALAEVWPCVWSAFGHLCYAQESLTGDALAAWLTKHHDDLVELAMDISCAERERHDEMMMEMRER